jgi:hypothetical protein
LSISAVPNNEGLVVIKISGTPTAAGAFTCTLAIKDARGNRGEVLCTLVVEPYGMSINGPETVAGKQYSALVPTNFTVTGGVAPYTWSSTPPLPTALMINYSTGAISGNVTAPAGNYTVAIKVIDGNKQTATKNVTFVVTGPDPVVWVTPETLPQAQVAATYAAVNLAASGGRPGYTYALKPGSALPPGLSLSAGIISGTPSAAGTFKFTLIASDAQSPKATAEREFTLVVQPYGMSVSGPETVVGKQYSPLTPTNFTVTGGVSPTPGARIHACQTLSRSMPPQA